MVGAERMSSLVLGSDEMHEHGIETGAGFADIVWDVVQDAVVDTLYLIPFLLVTYLIMEWLEHKTSMRTQQAIRRAGAAGPVIGAFLGVVPQCGFSAAASTLYAGRVITLGTLFAVYLSTSDEMLPIFIAEQVPIGTMLGILGMKVAIGIAFGFVVDFFLRATHRDQDSVGRRSGRMGCSQVPRNGSRTR